MRAAREGHTPIVQLLLYYNAQVDLETTLLNVNSKQLVKHYQQEVATQKLKALAFLCCARNSDEENPSLFDKDYLPLDMFKLILRESRLLNITKENVGLKNEVPKNEVSKIVPKAKQGFCTIF